MREWMKKWRNWGVKNLECGQLNEWKNAWLDESAVNVCEAGWMKECNDERNEWMCVYEAEWINECMWG